MSEMVCTWLASMGAVLMFLIMFLLALWVAEAIIKVAARLYHWFKAKQQPATLPPFITRGDDDEGK